ncbi:MAG: hypothetical protein EZS28_047161 [Streblomastix strix]|uniref:Uncharacterized protein n=1 Tax=Streblomastix strix TaxID=222440 RepID=A0A5J4THE4_9EUKA|nr:MAG: hypothetical protein EZS28_047161 [Streblomastix strix]
MMRDIIGDSRLEEYKVKVQWVDSDSNYITANIVGTDQWDELTLDVDLVPLRYQDKAKVQWVDSDSNYIDANIVGTDQWDELTLDVDLVSLRYQDMVKVQMVDSDMNQ